MQSIADQILTVSQTLAAEVDKLRFEPPVAYRYNPLEYAWEPFSEYVNRFAQNKKDVLLIGMNPGPFGMAQTGIPFGDVHMVRDWLDISGSVGKPSSEHPKRRIEGFSCARGEVSGQRLWGWAQSRYQEPGNFFRRFFVWNYCPLVFMEEGGKNLTPDKLPKSQREELFKSCDCALAAIVKALDVEYAIGVGKFAEDRARVALAGTTITVGTILHPSPASPAANRGWQAQAEQQLQNLGIRL